MTPFDSLSGIPAEVAAVFDAYDEAVRAELLALRDLILDTARETKGVGAITEALRWGQPAYLTMETRSGSTIRLAPAGPKSGHDVAMFFICHTKLVERFEGLFGDTFRYEGGRALLFMTGDQRSDAELRVCIEMALTYHLGS